MRAANRLRECSENARQINEMRDQVWKLLDQLPANELASIHYALPSCWRKKTTTTASRFTASWRKWKSDMISHRGSARQNCWWQP